MQNLAKPWTANSRGKKQESRAFLRKCWSGLKGQPYSCLLSSSAQAVITNYHRLGGLHNTHLFLIVLGSGMSEIRVPTDVLPSEGFLPGLQLAVFLLCLYVVEREKKAFYCLSL